ncbi:ThiF family protein [Rhizobium sp. PP-F2F-G36]|nr:ThiF family protein [Rhizobium sp. PP-F2F-G36]
MGNDVVFLVDRHFPYSKPQAFIENYDLGHPQPHTEPLPRLEDMARLCLQTAAVPNDPMASIEGAFVDARELLKANETGSEDHDFEDDFGAYWRHYLPPGSRHARLHGLAEATPGTGVFFYRSKAYYCFPNKLSLRRWYVHLTDAYVRDPLRFPIIALKRLPKPDRYPHDHDSLVSTLKRYTEGGMAAVGGMLRACPSRLPVIFAGIKPDGSAVQVAVELVRRLDQYGRTMSKARAQSKLADSEVIALYDITPLDTRHLDAALTRLPNSAAVSVRKKVAIVGCGALGSGIAIMLGKAGVSNFILVDPDTLGWENVRRHELGADCVGVAKTEALRTRIQKSIPDIAQVESYPQGIQALLASKPKILDDVDLVISATGEWGADVFISDKVALIERPVPVLYTWMEAYALAGHTVVTSGKNGRFVEGFDEVGNFKGKASAAELKIPHECGNTTSPFGAIELAQSQAVASRLAIEVLAGRHDGDVWRTWTAEESVLEYAQGSWSEYWLATRGKPPGLGGVSEGEWKF